MMKDILETIEGKEIILKMDIEGYECKALQPEILLNKVGKFIPFISMEWVQLPTNRLKTCPEFSEWVKNFYIGGYVPVHPGKKKNSIYCLGKFSFNLPWKRSGLVHKGRWEGVSPIHT